MTDSTIKFTVPGEDKQNMRKVLRNVFDALNEKGYNPINQIVGYLLTEDPTYITNYNNARTNICKLDRDELLHELVRCYLFDKKRFLAKRLLLRRKPLVHFLHTPPPSYRFKSCNKTHVSQFCPLRVDKRVTICYYLYAR